MPNHRMMKERTLAALQKVGRLGSKQPFAALCINLRIGSVILVQENI
nr:hypothetical protein [Planktomarina sp.]